MQIAYDNKRRTLNRKFAEQGHRFMQSLPLPLRQR
jgi:hypothetical protein